MATHVYINNYIPTETTEKVHFNHKYYIIGDCVDNHGDYGTIDGKINLKQDDNGYYIFKNAYCHVKLAGRGGDPDLEFEGKILPFNVNGYPAGTIGLDKLVNGQPISANLVFTTRIPDDIQPMVYWSLDYDEAHS